jgi:hypothetical protein
VTYQERVHPLAPLRCGTVIQTSGCFIRSRLVMCKRCNGATEIESLEIIDEFIWRFHEVGDSHSADVVTLEEETDK